MKLVIILESLVHPFPHNIDPFASNDIFISYFFIVDLHLIPIGNGVHHHEGSFSWFFFNLKSVIIVESLVPFPHRIAPLPRNNIFISHFFYYLSFLGGFFFEQSEWVSGPKTKGPALPDEQFTTKLPRNK